jgi:hypothetical protein
MSLYTKTIPNLISEFAPEADAVEHQLNIDNNFLYYKLLSEGAVKLSIKLDYTLITEHNNYYDQTMWAFTGPCINAALSGLSQAENKNTYFYSITEEDIIPVLKRTILTKFSKLFETPGLNAHCLFRFFVPSASMSPNDIDYIFGADENYTASVKYNNSTAQTTELNKMFDLVEPIQITTNKDSSNINPGDTITVNVSTAANISFVYVEQISGNINRTMVPLQNGIGNFTVSTSGLETGDVISFKVGFKYATGLAKFTKVIS